MDPSELQQPAPVNPPSRAPSESSERSTHSRSPASATRTTRPVHHRPHPYRAEDLQETRNVRIEPEASRRSGHHNIPGVYRDHNLGRSNRGASSRARGAASSGRESGSGHMHGLHGPNNKPIKAPDFGNDPLYPVTGHCLCGDFTITVLNPRPGMIICHCYDCQVNSASFFGTYISAESLKSVILAPSQRDEMESEAELTRYDAIPEGKGAGCPRTYCRSCCTMLYAEPSSIGIIAVNAGLFQNHTRHPAFQLGMEIFTDRRVKWLKPMPGAIQSELMPNLGGGNDQSDSTSYTTGPDEDQMDASA